MVILYHNHHVNYRYNITTMKDDIAIPIYWYAKLKHELAHCCKMICNNPNILVCKASLLARWLTVQWRGWILMCTPWSHQWWGPLGERWFSWECPLPSTHLLSCFPSSASAWVHGALSLLCSRTCTRYHICLCMQTDQRTCSSFSLECRTNIELVRAQEDCNPLRITLL